MMRAGSLSRIPRETKVGTVVLAVALLQVLVLAVVGLGQNERRRDDAERDLIERAGRALVGLQAGVGRAVAAQEMRLRAEIEREDRPIEVRIQDALRAAPLYTAAHLLDSRGEAADISRLPIEASQPSVDIEARRRVDALLATERDDPAAAASRAADLAAELERAPRPDAVAVALALQSGARAAWAARDGQRAADFARRILRDHAAVRDDRGPEGESEPFGPAAAHVLCEVLLLAIPAGDDAAQAEFVRTVLDRRITAQRLRGVLSDAAYAVERSECLRVRAAAVALRVGFQQQIDDGLRLCDTVDAGLALVRTAPRAGLLGAIGRGDERLPLPSGDLLFVAPAPRAPGWSSVAFTARADDLRDRVLYTELDASDAPDGVAFVVRDAVGAVVAEPPSEDAQSGPSDRDPADPHALRGSSGEASQSAPLARNRADPSASRGSHGEASQHGPLARNRADTSASRGSHGEASQRVLAETRFGAALPGLVAAAVLSDPSVIDREADAARTVGLWVLGGAVLAIVAASLLAVRAVMREMRLARLRSDFASNLSHELRTPLTSLRMFVDTLREGRVRDPAEAKECLDVVAQETERLSSLVERILQFAAFAKGRAPIEMKSGDAGEVTKRAVVLFRKRAEASGATLDFRVDGPLPESILDRDAIVQVVLNLLDNAVKHSGDKPPRVRVVVRPHPAGGHGVAVLVEDGGPGVSERERDLVFEEFYRGDDSLSRRTQGAGLGLALSKRIALAHGGRIDVVRSADLGGACFRVFLPDAATGRRLVVAAQAGGSR